MWQLLLLLPHMLPLLLLLIPIIFVMMQLLLPRFLLRLLLLLKLQHQDNNAIFGCDETNSNGAWADNNDMLFSILILRLDFSFCFSEELASFS